MSQELMSRKFNLVFDNPSHGAVLSDYKHGGKDAYVRVSNERVLYDKETRTLTIESGAVSTDKVNNGPDITMRGILAFGEGKTNLTLESSYNAPASDIKTFVLDGEIKTITTKETITGVTKDYTPEEYLLKFQGGHNMPEVKDTKVALDILQDGKKQNEMPALRAIVENYRINPWEVAAGMGDYFKLSDAEREKLDASVKEMNKTQKYVPEAESVRIVEAIKNLSDPRKIGEEIGKAVAASKPVEDKNEVANGTNVSAPNPRVAEVDKANSASK